MLRPIGESIRCSPCFRSDSCPSSSRTPPLPSASSALEGSPRGGGDEREDRPHSEKPLGRCLRILVCCPLVHLCFGFGFEPSEDSLDALFRTRRPQDTCPGARALLILVLEPPLGMAVVLASGLLEGWFRTRNVAVWLGKWSPSTRFGGETGKLPGFAPESRVCASG